ncbi:snake [Carabus blaptoides fortunei]
MLLSYICLLIVSSACVSGQFSVGDSCTLQSNNAAGQCVLLKNCPKALEDIRKRINPQICTYQGKEPVVCCEKGTSTRVVGDICKQKCKEYGKKVFELEYPPVYDIDIKPIEINTCAVIVAPLIVGGKDANPREYPHMALLGYGEKGDILWRCGGTLISEQFILTAGHCLHYRNVGPVRWIRVGELVLGSNTDEARPKDFSVLESIKHPQYLPPSSYNDIALVKVNGQIPLGRFVRPACLHTTTFINATRYIATGWGITQFGASKGSDALQKVILDSFSQDQCNTSYESNISDRKLKFGIVPETQMCAGGTDREKDACQGDSGGPLQIFSKEVYCMYNIVGVTSFGKTCGVTGSPGVYTRVSQYIDWIEKTVWPELI